MPPHLHIRMELGNDGRTIAEHTTGDQDTIVTVGEHARDNRFRYALGVNIPPELELFTRDKGGWNVLRLPKPSYDVWFSEGTWKPVKGGPGEWAHLAPGVSGLVEIRFLVKKDDKALDQIVRIYFKVL